MLSLMWNVVIKCRTSNVIVSCKHVVDCDSLSTRSYDTISPIYINVYDSEHETRKEHINANPEKQ